MRKTSQDGGDSTSITSGVENETKKSALKPKKSSLKRKAPNFGQESDDTVIEPLLQRENDKSELQSAKYFGKRKTDSLPNKESENKDKTTTTTGFCGTTESLLSFKDSETSKITSDVVAPVHNYMNTNMFNTHDNAKVNVTKSQILVEIDACKQSGYTPSPLIFTTAKIHTDEKSKQMQPVHVTPVPILSTIEVTLSKGGSYTTNEKKVSNGSSVINPVYSPMPLSIGKEEKVTVTTVISPSINKDAFGKAVTVTSTTKLGNITTAQSNSMLFTIPSTSSNSVLKKSNTKDIQGDVKDVNKEPMLSQNLQFQPKAYKLDDTKNNVTVKTITPSSAKVTDISTKSAKTNQGDKAQKSDGNVSLNKTDTSQIPVGISYPVKNTNSFIANKQLQRQKTTTEEVSNIESKTEPHVEQTKTSSAKMPLSSYPKTTESISIKDVKLPNISANNTQNTKYSINNIANSMPNTISTSTAAKPTLVTSVALSSTISASVDVSSKPSTAATTCTNMGEMVSPTTTKALSNVNKINTASTVSPTSITKSKQVDVAKTFGIPTSIVTANCPEITSMQTQPQLSVSKTLAEKASVGNASAAKTIAPVSSVKSKAGIITTAKQYPVVATTTTPTSTQPQSNSTSKATVSKAPSTSSVKADSVSSITSTAAKPSSSSSLVPSSNPLQPLGTVAAVKAPAVTTAIANTLVGAVYSITTTAQNTTLAQGSAGKQGTSVAGINATTKIPIKPSTMKVNVPVSMTTSVKSANDNSTQMFSASKPSSTSISKTEPVTTLSKTSAGSSSQGNLAFTVKSPQGGATPNRKESAASVKKHDVTKSQPITTKSLPASSANKSIVGTTTKIPISEASPVSSATKKPGATALTKMGSVTTSATKTSSVSTSTKASGVTPLSTTTSASAIKPPAKTTTHVNETKSVGIVGSSVPSTSVLRPTESAKKGGSKSSDKQ